MKGRSWTWQSLSPSLVPQHTELLFQRYQSTFIHTLDVGRQLFSMGDEGTQNQLQADLGALQEEWDNLQSLLVRRTDLTEAIIQVPNHRFCSLPPLGYLLFWLVQLLEILDLRSDLESHWCLAVWSLAWKESLKSLKSISESFICSLFAAKILNWNLNECVEILFQTIPRSIIWSKRGIIAVLILDLG